MTPRSAQRHPPPPGPIRPLVLALVLFASVLAAVPARAGQLVSASCPCGFHKDRLFVFGGRANFKTVCMFPALCRATGDLVLVNLLDPQAPARGCPEKAIPLDDPSLAPKKPAAVAASWNLAGLGRTVRLYATGYVCPRCHRHTLGFSAVGFWD